MRNKSENKTAKENAEIYQQRHLRLLERYYDGALLKDPQKLLDKAVQMLWLYDFWKDQSAPRLESQEFRDVAKEVMDREVQEYLQRCTDEGAWGDNLIWEEDNED